MPGGDQSSGGRPKPREVAGLVAPALRWGLAGPYRWGLRQLLALRVKPDHLTVASLAVNSVVAVLLARGLRAAPACLLMVGGALDVFDGAVARARGISGPRGAWLDSVFDRISDALVLGGLFLSLALRHDRVPASLALAALGVSLLVSHVRAEAEARGARMGEGAFARAERFTFLVIGLLVPGALPYALGALAVLGAFTVVQRLLVARVVLRETPGGGR